MASSSSRKSNSSASKQKPTFRRSTGVKSQHRPSTARTAAPAPAAAPSKAAAKRARTYTAPTRKSASLRVSSAHGGKPSQVASVSRSAAPVAHKAKPRAIGGAVASSRKKPSPARAKTTVAAARPVTATSVPASKPARQQAAKASRTKKKTALPSSVSASGRVRATAGPKGPSLRERLSVAALTRRMSSTRSTSASAPHEGPSRPREGSGSAGIARLAVVIVLLVVVLGGIGAAIVFNSGLFAATNVIVNGSAHIPQQTAQQLVDVADGTTLLNVNEKELSERLVENPWVERVEVERQFPHTLVVTPVECDVSAIVYIVADDVAWAISDDDVWIAPLSVAVPQAEADSSQDQAADGDEAAGEGTSSDGEADAGADEETSSDAGTADDDEGAGTTSSGIEAALQLARDNGAVLLTDVGTDVSPSSGKAVDSDVILAAMKYVHGFSSEFLAQVKDISVPSIEAISLNLDSGVEVSLGSPEDIQQKEQVVRSLLEQQEGVTYINVRVPDAYTFRSADV